MEGIEKERRGEVEGREEERGRLTDIEVSIGRDSQREVKHMISTGVDHQSTGELRRSEPERIVWLFVQLELCVGPV